MPEVTSRRPPEPDAGRAGSPAGDDSRTRSAATWAAPAAIVPGGLADAAQVAGMAAFFAGIAAGLLLVFTDRHGYERPVPARLVALLLAAGVCLTIAGEIGRHLGV